MKKYKLNKDNIPVPTEKEVSQYKDFANFKANYDELTKNRHKVPLYKNRKMFLLLLLILLILWLLTKEDKNTIQKDPSSPADTVQVD